MRQLAVYEEHKADFDALGVTVYAASVDALEQTREVVNRGLTFDVGYGITREECDRLGGWWDEKRMHMDPAEFVLGRGGVVLGSMYSSGPVGRMSAETLIQHMKNREKRRLADSA